MKEKALYREGKITLIILIVFALVLLFINPVLSLIGIGFIIFVIYFFRDPNREITEGESIVLSPADGIITNIFEIKEDKFIKGNSICISIFMSPLDVHINRSPIQGIIEYVEYKKGRFIMATKPESHEVNEKNYIGISDGKIKVLVVQIAGILARRIVNWSEINQNVKKGEKLGMIKFSSGTQIIIPNGIELNVKKGDKVISGETIIGRYSQWCFIVYFRTCLQLVIYH